MIIPERELERLINAKMMLARHACPRRGQGHDKENKSI
jgi:hypothetical protein